MNSFSSLTRFLLVLTLAVSCTVVPADVRAHYEAVRVVMDNNYPPYVFRNDDGILQGILIDQWRLWEQKTGIPVTITALDWDKALHGMKAGEFDVIDTIFRTDERAEWLDFSQPYAQLEVPIFFDKEISGITDAASLKGFVVAAKAGDTAVDILKRSGINSLMLFNSYEDVIRNAKAHKAPVFVVDKPPALYFLHKYGISSEYRQSAPLYTGQFHRAVRKGNSRLLATVEDGFRRITPAESGRIETKWFGSSLGNGQLTRNILFALGGVFLLLCGLFVWNRTLRRMVTARMAELEASEETVRTNEAFVKTLMNAIPVPIFFKDNAGLYLGSNDSYEEFYGLPQDKIIGKSVFDIAPRELAEIYHAKDRELFEQGGTQVYETQVRNVRGDLRDVIFHKAAFTDSGGNVCGLIGAILDITDRKNAEENRLNLERQLLHAQKLESLGILSGGIAHDFNNLLLAVLGNLDLALMKLPRETPARNNIDQAIKAARHAAKLTGMMLAYSGKAMFIIKPLNLTELVEENALMWEAAIPRSITLERHLDHTVPIINADAGQLQQIIMNLITNAAEAIGESNGTIRLVTGSGYFDQSLLNESRLDEKGQPGCYVWLEVSDNGCGMNEETVHKLFDPFFTTKFTGRGLGMSAVLGILRAHNGAFLVKSVPGSGTTIKVLFPVSSGGPIESNPEGEHKKRRESLAGHTCRVLVIDDEETIRSVTADMLGELGFEAVEAASGEEGLALLAEAGSGIDIVLLDQVMPGMDGVSTFRELRRIRPDIKVVLASGFSQLEVSERFAGLGLNGFLSKPYVMKELADELSLALRGADA